jgi:CheY-like chemotaxis protein
MRKRILIVEDHADIRKLIHMTLEFEDYDIHEAANADEGLVAVQQLRPHLLLLDVMMPGTMDGLDLCRRIKSDPSLGLPQVVLLTARGQSQDIEAGMNAGADAYLLKPFSPLKLIETLDNLLSAPTSKETP